LNAGAFIAIKNAYDESTDSAKKVNASENTVKEAADVREEAEDIQNQVQPNNIRDLVPTRFQSFAYSYFFSFYLRFDLH